jgi:hypothetical protein
MHNPYRHIRPTESRSRRLTREVIGRAALTVIAFALLWGGYKCIRTSYVIQREFNQQHTAPTRATSGSGVPFAIGVVLLVVGSPFLFAAVVPVRAVEKLLGRQSNNTLWQNPDPGSAARSWFEII